MTGTYERLSREDISLLSFAIDVAAANGDEAGASHQGASNTSVTERVEKVHRLQELQLLLLSGEVIALSKGISSFDRAADRSVATVDDDAKKLIHYLQREGIEEADAVNSGWNHMGAIIVDAVLQANRTYKTTVLPRVQNIISEHPTADTVTRFLALASRADLTQVTNFNDTARAERMVEIAKTFQGLGIETVEDLRSRLQGAGEEREAVRVALVSISGVGPKTVDYFDLLVGNPEGLAIDLRVKRVLKQAGVSYFDYDHCANVLRSAARQLEWPLSGLDALLWRIGETEEL